MGKQRWGKSHSSKAMLKNHSKSIQIKNVIFYFMSNWNESLSFWTESIWFSTFALIHSTSSSRTINNKCYVVQKSLSVVTFLNKTRHTDYSFHCFRYCYSRRCSFSVFYVKVMVTCKSIANYKSHLKTAEGITACC